MKQKLLVLIFGFSLLLFMYVGTRFAFKSRATGINLAVKMKLQGSYQTENKLNMRIDVYSGPTKVASFPNAQVMYSGNGYFEGLVMLTQDFDLTRTYALFIKPDKYLGQLFCSTIKTGTECQYPEFIFKAGLNELDIRAKIFYAGDLAPADGKVDSGDISKIFASIGKANIAADINNDGIVNGTDYNLAQKTLALNKTDDIISLQTLVTSTPTPTSLPTISAGPTLTSFPTPSVIPTMTVAPTLTSIPTVTVIPTATGTPPLAGGKGKCNYTLTGKVKIKYLNKTECERVNQKSFYCVENQNECTSKACLTKLRAQIEAGINDCSYGMAELDPSSVLDCVVTYTASSSCTPPTAQTYSCEAEATHCTN